MGIERLLWTEDATGLAGLVKSGEVDPAELVDAAITRAERVNPEINAIAERLYDRARQKARSTDRSKPLAGVPFAIKDLGIAINGVPVHSGSRVAAFVPDYDSVLTARYFAAGLIPVVTISLSLMRFSMVAASPSIDRRAAVTKPFSSALS